MVTPSPGTATRRTARSCERRPLFVTTTATESPAAGSTATSPFTFLSQTDCFGATLPVQVHTAAVSPGAAGPARDRKSTRLNSSHSQISYAVFCLKKKNISHLPRYGASREQHAVTDYWTLGPCAPLAPRCSPPLSPLCARHRPVRHTQPRPRPRRH